MDRHKEQTFWMIRVLVPIDGSEDDAHSPQFLRRFLGGMPELQVVLLHVAEFHLLASAGMYIGGPHLHLDAQKQQA